MNKMNKMGTESSLTEDNRHKRSGQSIDNSRGRGPSEMKFSSKFIGAPEQPTLEDPNRVPDDLLQSFNMQTQVTDKQLTVNQTIPNAKGRMPGSFPFVSEEYPDRASNPASNQHSSTYQAHQEYLRQLNHVNEWKEHNCLSDMSDTTRFQLWQKQQQQVLELHIDGDDHDRRRVCIKQCCLQNAIQSKLKLNEKQDHVARVRQEREQLKQIKQQKVELEKSIDTPRDPRSIAVAKPTNAAPIALVHFADNNLESWRQQQ